MSDEKGNYRFTQINLARYRVGIDAGEGYLTSDLHYNKGTRENHLLKPVILTPDIVSMKKSVFH